jgi:hypothetical protein
MIFSGLQNLFSLVQFAAVRTKKKPIGLDVSARHAVFGAARNGAFSKR